jgi:ubiquitin-conjugating enzyme E2 O
MAACNIFEEDEVYKITRDGISYGLVLETAEYTSSDEEEDNFENEDKVKKGSLRVAWHPEGSEEVVKEDEVCINRQNIHVSGNT